jgi:CheY-like chemotaxis protein
MTTGNPHILIAEDDSEDRFIMSECFRDMGRDHCAHFAEDGILLMQYLEAVDASDINLVVLDLNMPRLNGTETLRALKSSPAYRHIPVIIFSTSINEIEKAACMELGALEYMTKPTKWNEYMTACRQLLEIATPNS